MSIQAQCGNIKGCIVAKDSITGFIAKPVGYVDYTGTHEVMPKVEPQTLPTANKRLTDDITVLAIPFYEVSNAAGGNTFCVG